MKTGFYTIIRHFAEKITFEFNKKEIRIYKKPDTVYKNGRLT